MSHAGDTRSILAAASLRARTLPSWARVRMPSRMAASVAASSRFWPCAAESQAALLNAEKSFGLSAIARLYAASAALGHFTTVGDSLRQVECFELMGDLNSAEGGDTETALVCYRRGAALARDIGAAAHVARLCDRIVAAQRATRAPRAATGTDASAPHA